MEADSSTNHGVEKNDEGSAQCEQKEEKFCLVGVLLRFIVASRPYAV